MIVSFRTKYFAATLLVVVLVGLTSGLYAQHALAVWLAGRTENQLRRHALLLRHALSDRAAALDKRQWDTLIDQWAAGTGMRVTLIAPDGTLLGDSELSGAALAQAANHGDRPEVIAAWTHGSGVARRASGTLGEAMLYLALPLEAPVGRPVVVRVAMPERDLQAGALRLRLLLVVSGLLGLAMAVVVGAVVAQLMFRSWRHVVAQARASAEAARAGRKRLWTPVGGAAEIGRLAGSINVMADELQRSVVAREDERVRFQAVLESMGEAVLALDHQQHVTLANPAAVALLALPSDFLGQSLLAVTRLEALTTLAARGTTQAAAAELQLPPPCGRCVLARATPLGRMGGAGGVVMVMHDVTERRRLESMRRDFIANASHELRTPITVIQGNAEILLQGALHEPERAHRFVEAVHRHAERLSRIIADLLDLSRLEAGRYSVDLQCVGVGPFLQRAVEAVAEIAAKKGLVVQVDAAAAGEALAVLADAKALDQVLLNLVDNAVKYTPEGGSVWLRAWRRAERVRLEVQDTGAGIAPEHRERIFERFYRIDPGRSRDAGGTGLGLSIVKHLLDSMGGTVGVEPAPPSGTLFWLELAAAQSEMGSGVPPGLAPRGAHVA